MFELTREVRFAVVPRGTRTPDQVYNSYAGFPPVTGIEPYLTLRVSLRGELDPQTQYLRNIRDIDTTIRRIAIPLITRQAHYVKGRGDFSLVARLIDLVQTSWTPATLHRVELSLSPYLAVSCIAGEHPMIRLSHRFEFSAAHRLHNPNFSESENQSCYGKCNNPHGHGHNYVVQVTLRGEPDQKGQLIEIPRFEQIVDEQVIEPFDHKHLNEQISEFSTLIPTVENIAQVVYRRLKPHLSNQQTQLASVTVWETTKTWCEYSED